MLKGIFIVVLVTCKNEENPSKVSLLHSYLISNPSKILWLSLWPARMKKIQSKVKKLEWSQDFPFYNHMGVICFHGNQSSNSI